MLPPITSTGAQTLGFMVNGRIWIPRVNSPSLVNPIIELESNYSRIDSNITIIAKRRDVANDGHEQMYLSSNPFGYATGDTIRFSTSSNYQILNFFRFNDTSLIFNYVSIPSNDSYIVYSRFDTIEGIASGIFSASLVSDKDSLDTLQITRGRFDVGI